MTGQTTKARPPRILIVEDEGIIAMRLERLLTHMGYEVAGMASSGEEALQLAMGQPPDLVLMDIQLAGALDGVETASRMQGWLDAPIIYLSAHPERMVTEETQRTQPYGFLSKPVQDQELRAAVEMALYKHRMEAQLRESEKKYRLLAENVEDVIWQLNETLDAYTYVSPSVIRLLGYTPDEMMKMPLEALLAPNSRSQIQTMMRDWLVEGSRAEEDEERRRIDAPHTWEAEYVRKDGATVWLESRTRSLWGEDGAFQGLVGVTRDISERKQAERITQARLRIAEASATRSSEALMQMTLDEIEALTGSEIGFYHLVLKDQETLALQTWSTNTLQNMCQAEGKGRHYKISEAGVWVDCIHERAPVIHNNYSALPHRQGLPPGHPTVIRELVFPIMRRGRVVAILGVGNKANDYDQRDVDLISLLGDFSWEIIERKQAEEALKESEEKYRGLVEQSLQGIVIAQDDPVRLVFVNQAMQTITGFSPEELKSFTSEQLAALIHPDHRETFFKNFRNRLQGQDVAPRAEYRLLHKSGTYRWVEIYSALIEYEGSPATQTVFLDVTERKRSKESTEHLNRVLRAINGVNQLVSREDDRDRMLQGACDLLVKTRGYHNAWIVLLDPDGTVTATAEAGLGDAFAPLLDHLKHGELTACGRSALAQSDIVLTRDPFTACADCPLAANYAGRAAMTIRLEHGGKVYGLLTVSIPPHLATLEEEQVLLREIGEDVAFVLQTIEWKEERKRAEDALRKSESRIRRKLDSILTPDGDLGALDLTDVIDVEAIQALMDKFYELTKIGIAIVDLKGEVLVATGWQDICTQFHRVHPETRRYCIESDTALSSGVPPGEYKLYKCKNNLWDMATPIVVGDQHVGNLFLGQFFFDDEEVDRELFRKQAQMYGFDEDAYLAALDRVPRWSRERVEAVFSFYTQFAQMTSKLSHSNLKLARALAERERLLAAHKESEQKFRSYIENAPYGIFVVNQAGRYVEVNEAACRMTGYERDELLDMQLAQLAPPEHHQLVETHFQRVVEEGFTTGEATFITKDGRLRWISVRAVRLSENCLLGYTADVTERKRAEEALRESEREKALILNHTNEIIAFHNQHRRIIWANRAYIQAVSAIVGEPQTLDDIKGKRCYEAWGLGQACDKCPVIMVLETDLPHESELTPRNQSHWPKTQGAWRVRAAPVRDSAGTIIGAIEVSYNITERKRAEEALRENEKRLRKANAAKDRFFSIIAHDLKTPLLAVTSGAEMLKEHLQNHQDHQDHDDQDDQVDQFAREMSQELHHAAQHLSKLLENLLTWSQTQRGKIVYKPTRVDVHVAAHACIDILHESAAQKRITLVNSIEEGTLVYADDNMLDAIIRNLLSNAIKFTPHGGEVTIEAQTRGRFVEISVVDSGIGMSEDKMQRLFKLGERNISTAGTDGEIGTGLGLILCQEFVKKHGGEIWADSQKGQGSKLTFALPRFEWDKYEA